MGAVKPHEAVWFNSLYYKVAVYNFIVFYLTIIYSFTLSLSLSSLCSQVHGMVHKLKSKDKLHELVLSFHQVGPRPWYQVIMHGNKTF